jgi:RimJ/RimL family protein N-acetyltransferase
VETERLRAEPVAERHHAALCELLGDPRVGANLGGVADPGAVARQIARQASHWAEHGFGYWVWLDRETGEPVARGGLSNTNVGGRDEIEVGWSVWPARWGQGYATELGAASLRFGFEDLGLTTIVSYTLHDNRASRRVMEKLGFEYERDVVHADLPHVLYRHVQSSVSSARRGAWSEGLVPLRKLRSMPQETTRGARRGPRRT